MVAKKINKRKGKITHYDKHALSRICWGMLLYMMGLSEDNKQILKDMVRKKGYKPLNNTIIEIAELLTSHKTDQKPTERSAIRKSLVKSLGKLFDPENNNIDAPKLGKECPRSDDYRKANDSPSAGYSRDAFKEISKKYKPEIALATIAYLVRAHADFFCRPKIERDFNAAKVSLNDIFQATQLGCRLYYALPESHFKKYSQQDYLDKVRTEPNFDDDPWDSPFFIWWALELVEIWRGNVYRQIGYIDESERYYRHAQERFDRLSNEPLDVSISHIKAETNTDSPDKYFITPTMIRALFERSKILFDQGLFLESMMNQLRCLAYLMRMSTKAGTRKSNSTLIDLTRVLKFLDVVRKQCVWDKEKITRLFGHPKNELKKIDILKAPLEPERFIDSFVILSPSNRELVAEIFARLAFTLFMLRRSQMPFSREKRVKKNLEQDNENIARWLRPYLGIYKELKLERQPPLAWYTKTFLVDKKKTEPLTKKDEVVLEERVERQLAYRLREIIVGNSHIIAPLEEKGFYNAVLDSVTQNIGNIVTIPRQLNSLFMRHGYKHRRAYGDLSHKTLYESLENKESSNVNRIQNKLVILRRWQSYNPKIPRPLGSKVKGGGYFLLWKGKGIVIDPGYDFIQNFYDEGFSLEDIDAIIVTHSHPDHDDDFSSLITFIWEWNKYHKQMGYPEAELLNIDIFLNESTHLKFSDWLKSSKAGIGRVIELPLVVWNIDSQKWSERIRGENVTLNLRNEYHFDLEVVPAWHDDVIGKTAAVGLKFHLYDPDIGENEVGVVGYTGDTGAYDTAHLIDRSTNSPLLIRSQYNDCDVLVAHLGDIKLRELSTVIGESTRKGNIGNCINRLLHDWFYDPNKKRVTKRRVTKQRVEAFLNLLIVLNIAPTEALEAKIEYYKDGNITVGNALYNFIQKEITALREKYTYGFMEDKLKSLLPPDLVAIGKEFTDRMTEAVSPKSGRKSLLKEWQIAYILLGFLCSSSLMPWYYPYHLGISGLYRLHRALVENEEKPGRNKIFIVGELPEELASYRHHIARLLNATQSTIGQGRTHSFTGDIGMHISLTIGENSVLDPKIRCTYCNYNNESVLNNARPHYHRPDKILETALKRLESAMIYLCTEHDHHPELQDKPFDFLSSPNVSVI